MLLQTADIPPKEVLRYVLVRMQEIWPEAYGWEPTTQEHACPFGSHMPKAIRIQPNFQAAQASQLFGSCRSYVQADVVDGGIRFHSHGEDGHHALNLFLNQAAIQCALIP